MAVSKKLKGLYMGFFDGIETWCANKISNYQERRYLRKYAPNEPIPADYKKAVKEFWKKYTKVSPKWAWYYASRNGIIDPRYIPNTLIYTKIDQHFNNRKIGYGFNDKNYYSLIFKEIKQPEVLARNIGGVFVDEDYNLISIERILSLISTQSEVICKPSLESGSGRSIQFWDTVKDKDVINAFLNNKQEFDYIIQKIIEQHEELKKVHSNSVNSLRIVSVLMQEGVYILSSNLRMGIDKGRVDNVTAGGISCGINDNGTLKKYATAYYTGERFEKHPQGLVFEGFKVPSYDKAVELVKQAHPLIPHFRLVSWDIAINKEGEPILIEANMRKGGINLNQFNNGPLFGDLTERILDEVFCKH